LTLNTNLLPTRKYVGNTNPNPVYNHSYLNWYVIYLQIFSANNINNKFY